MSAVHKSRMNPVCVAVLAATCVILSHSALAQSKNRQSNETVDKTNNESVDSTSLKTIVVEPVGEPEAALPLGTGISGKTLVTTPGSAGDPLRTLQSLPGMAFTDDSEPEPAVRGSRPDDNYFQVDFLPTDYLFHAGGLISVFNPDLVESFSIYPSAYGPEFSGVNGGVFDVKLRDPATDRFRTTLDISMLQSGVLLEGPVSENQSFYLAGRFSYLDLLVGDQLDEEEDDEGIAVVQFPKYTDYQAKYVWAPNDKSTVRLQATGATDDAIFDIDEDADDIQTDPIIAGRFIESSKLNQQGVVWDTQLSDAVSVKAAIGHNTENEKFQIGGAGRVEIGTETWLSKAQITLPIGEDHDISIGGEVAREDYAIDLNFNVPICTEFEPDCTLSDAERVALNVDDSVNTGKFFIKDNWYVTDRLTLFPGLAIQTEDLLDKTFVEPRFALEYALADDLTLTAGAGIYHQRPGYGQVDSTLGNPNLKYIESTQVLLGLQKTFGHGWDLKSELYYKQLDNLVTGNETLKYTNDGEGTSYGLDTLLRKKLTDKLSGWFSLSLSDSSRTNLRTGEEFGFEYDQPVNASLVASYKLSEKWSLGAKLSVHSGALYTPVVGSTPDDEVEGLFNPEYGPLNSERFPTYQRLDIRLDRTVQKSNGRKYSAYLDVLNVLDNKNVAYYDYNADYSEREEGEQIPRIIALGFKAEF